MYVIELKQCNVNPQDAISQTPTSASNISYGFHGANMKGRYSRLTNKIIIYRKNPLKYLETTVNNELRASTLRQDYILWILYSVRFGTVYRTDRYL